MLASINDTELSKHQAVIDLIFSQMPEMQNAASSSWWFFLLFPEGPEGFGPRQLMFTIATRAGKHIRINDVRLAGLDRNRSLQDGRDEFEAMCVGWYCDGQTVHDEFIRLAGPAVIDNRAGSIFCGEGSPNGYGIQFRRSAHQPVGLDAFIRGAGGEAEFSTWGTLDSATASPVVSMNIDTPIGGTHYIGWRRLNFRGRFRLPSGEETLQGVGFFQRVCLNVPVFPWKWIWAVFPDQSVFTAYVPYIGLNLFRKGYRFFRSNRLEQATFSISQSAAWIPPGSAEPTRFTRMSATPILGQGPHPLFAVRASDGQGDEISFTAVPYGLSRFYIDRPILGGLVESHWNYNEYMFRVEDLAGTLSGTPVSRAARGQAFGSLEYTYGLGL
jgi:hypothetical protein